MQTRKTVRALLFDPDNRLLLMKIQGPQLAGPHNPGNRPFWITIGGEVRENETPFDTIRREITDETGITAFTCVKPIWYGQQILSDGDTLQLFHETFFICYTADTAISAGNQTMPEQPAEKEYRWWSPEDLALTTELVFPPILPQLILPIASGILPEQPLGIPLTNTR
jgi:2,3-bisphosphoglycerate-dependent phosphoglycerate mutase